MRSFAELARFASNHPLLGNPDPQRGGMFRVGNLVIVASWENGWDHVSVSLPDRCPSWNEMETVKRLFFRDTETAMQLHVPPAEHVNLHPFCLHLWRPQAADIPKPDKWMVL